MSEIKLFNRWKLKKSNLWWIGGVVLISILGFFVLVSSINSYSFSRNFANAPEMGGLMGGSGDSSDSIEEYFFEEGEMGADMAMEPQAESKAVGGGGAGDFLANTSTHFQIERLIIKNGDISIEVEDTRAARDEIEKMVSSMRSQGAFIVSSNEQGGGEENNPLINMNIRVPVERFEQTMDEIAAIGLQVYNRNEFSDDVTEEFVDVGARVKSLEAARDRLLEIMINADTTEDLLQAEQVLTQREVQIEGLKGRLKFLRESASLSRIGVNLQPSLLSQPIDTTYRPFETVRLAFEDLIDSLENFIDFMIFFVIATLPWLVLWGGIIYLVVRYFRNRGKAKPKTKGKKKR